MRNISKIFYVIAILILVLNCSNKENKEQENQIKKDNNSITKLEFINKITDFGNVPQDTILLSYFYFINTGDNELIINDVIPDCNCTGYKLSKDTVMPADTAYIKLEFNTEGKFGKQKKYTLVSANTKAELYKLTLKANIVD